MHLTGRAHYSAQAHPAYAGKIKCRVCSRTDIGSPLRMRGRLLISFAQASSGGLTPAYAGKILLWCSIIDMSGVHPRACGEDVSENILDDCISGSPPRMRGRFSGCLPGRRPYRLTPAHAGKIEHGDSADLSVRAHPRVCGEDCGTSCPFLLMIGSPPRMRGILKLHPKALAHMRLTPAYAGKIGRKSRA